MNSTHPVPPNKLIEAFEGEILHPGLDVRDRLLVVGFRYHAKADEEKEIFLVAHDGRIFTTDKNPIPTPGKQYWLDKRKRRLVRIEERWSVKELKAFLEEYNDPNKTLPQSKAIFEEIVDATKRHIELEQEADYWLLSAWIMGSYFYPVFSAYSFLHIKAPKRSGKSQCLNLLSQLCFNAVKARPSLAALSDTVDSLRGTYLIDQADSLTRKGQEDILDILADSYKRSGGKRRIVNFDKKGGREILEFETYSPKAFASIRELPEDLRDRCLEINLIRTRKNFPDPDDQSETWKELRGKLYKLLFTEYQSIQSTYEVRKIEYNTNREMLGRSLELWLPFEVILECCGMAENVLRAKKRFLSQYGFTEYEPSEFEEAVVKAVLYCLQENAELIITPSQICDVMDSDFFHPNATLNQRSSKVGWVIKRFNLASEKKGRTKEGVRYLFHKQKVENIYESYFKTASEATQHTPDSV